MRGSHQRTLIKTARRTLLEDCALPPGARILVAVSGGGDSQALLHVLALLRDGLGLQLFAHGVDHGLRPEAPRELDLAERLATSLEVPFTRSAVSLAPGSNLQARARAARYRELERVAAELDAAFIATAHHADDRAETVLLRLLRGSGPRGLAVLPARSGARLRPFIECRKRQILDHLERHAIDHAHDPSNDDPRFVRARVRTEVLPLLEQLSPRVVDHLNALAAQIGAEPPPTVLDRRGQPLRHGRAQIEQMARARQFGLTTARIQVTGAQELVLGPAGTWQVEPAAARPRRRSGVADAERTACDRTCVAETAAKSRSGA